MNTVIIRQALINIAEKSGRPHYPMCVVSEVVQSFIHDKEHFLKEKVLNESRYISMDFDQKAPETANYSTQSEWFKKRLAEQNTLIDELAVFCAPRHMKSLLSYYLNTSKSQLYLIFQKKRLFTDEQLENLNEAKKRTLKDFNTNFLQKAG
ncbi:hypothetical protein [Acinetobacter sp. CFCC 10889]|uniref:hypothetical protein n=1 Tax=Acinetobacter sp. CFCC 10889 TaxID=1775557 RepID=UPI000DD04D5A|nr:hypothetical protein [Acinetobacter sp. CFCC 10889]